MIHDLKILHIIPSSASGGAPINVCRYISRSLLRHFVVIGRDDDQNFNALEKYAQAIFNLPIRKLNLNTLLQIMRIAKKNQIDIIHSHGKGAGLYGRVASRRMGIGSVHTYRGYHNPYVGWKAGVYHKLEQHLSKWTNAAIAVSDSEKDKILQDQIIDSEKLFVIPNPIFPTLDVPNVHLPQSLERHVLCIARISPQKDIVTLLEVACLLKKQCYFHVFGGTNSSDISYEAQVHAHVKQRQVDNVYFHGDVPNASALIKRFPIFLSTARWEGLPTAIAEAMLSGVAVVATDCTGNIDLIKNRQTGLLCPVGNPIAIAQAIIELLEENDFRQKLACNGMRFAKNMFDIDGIVQNQEAIYNQVLRK